MFGLSAFDYDYSPQHKRPACQHGMIQPEYSASEALPEAPFRICEAK
jgi:hypothetical protein